MVRGRLQPALKYKVAQPMYNRYKFEQKGENAYQEMITLPSITGDLTMKNSYMGIDGREEERPKIKIKNGKQSEMSTYIAEL